MLVFLNLGLIDGIGDAVDAATIHNTVCLILQHTCAVPYLRFKLVQSYLFILNDVDATKLRVLFEPLP